MKGPTTPARARSQAWRERVAHLPRETRDTFFLLFAIAAAAGPHAAHLPLWCSALTVAMLAWRGWLAWRGQVLPGRWSLTAILMLVAALTFATHRTLLGREAGVTMLVMLMAMKTLELRARRDAFVVFFLGFFLVLTQYLYSQSLLTGLWTLLSIWALLTALVLAQMPIGQPSLRLAAGQALRSVAIGLPLMTLLFLLFPRIAPLWGVPSDAVGRTGLSNELQFGAMAEIANDDSVALRLRFVDGAAPPPPQSLYFRGPVLAAFDGRSWRALASPPPGRQSALAPRGALRRYELTLEPLRIAVLPLLEMSPEPAGALLPLDGGLLLRRGAELQWIAPRPITERLRLSSSAALDYEAGVQATPLSLQPFLELPPGRNPRTLAWAAALRNEPRFAALEGPALAEALVGAVLQHLRSNEYIYTLAPGRYGENGQELIDEFWMDRRLGFCEHFASGFAVVMRALGIPARIVTGFQGADRELQDGYLVVRQSQAHAWTEVWIAGRGWLRVDPTAAVAPERIASSLTLEAPPGVFAGAISQVNPALWRSLRRGWETLENRWQQTVLNYSRGDQFDLLKRMGWSRPDWAALGQLAAAVIAVLTLGALAVLAWQRRPHEPWQRLQADVLRRLARAGVDAQAHQGPRQWAARLEQRHGAQPAADLLRALDAARYGPASASWDASERRRWLAAFDSALRQLPAQRR